MTSDIIVNPKNSIIYPIIYVSKSTVLSIFSIISTHMNILQFRFIYLQKNFPRYVWKKIMTHEITLFI